VITYQVKVIDRYTLAETNIGEPTSERRAIRIAEGVGVNLNTDDFYVDYWPVENKLAEGSDK